MKMITITFVFGGTLYFEDLEILKIVTVGSFEGTWKHEEEKEKLEVDSDTYKKRSAAKRVRAYDLFVTY